MALSANESQFVAGVSGSTGIDPRVLEAWIASEGAPGNSYNNYLNIAYTTAQSIGVPASGIAAAGTAEFQTPQQGIAAAVKEINNLGLGHLGGDTPQQAIGQIAASPWASSHYGGAGGPNLVATFNSMFPGQLTSQYSGQQLGVNTGTTSPAPSQLSQVTGGVTSGLSSVESSLAGVGSSIGSGVAFLTSWRFAEIVGGVIMLALGLVLVSRNLFGTRLPRPAGAAAGALGRI